MSHNSVSLYNNNGTVTQFDGNSGSSGPSTASEVTYDNTQSELDATNVQEAIDELVETRPMSSATLNITTTTPELFGQTITATGTKETYTTTFSQTGEATINIKYVGQYTLTCQGASNTVTITSIGTTYTSTLDLEFATLDITCADTALYGESLTVSFGGSEIGTVAIDNEGKGTYKVFSTGTYTLSYTGKPSVDATVSALNTTVSVLFGLVLATFAAATEQQIADMVAAADAGLIDLYEDAGWRVGQSRTVHLSAMAATGVGESHAAQNAVFVLMNKGGKTLTTPTASGRTECSFIVGMQICLNETGYMNSTDTNAGSWAACARRTWCNSVFKNAIPSTLLPAFKQFQNITAQTYNGSTNQTTDDYFALPAAAEVFKGDPDWGSGGHAGDRSTAYSNLTEFNALSRFTYYETTVNRAKSAGGRTTRWAERSPTYNHEGSFCNVNTQGSGFTSLASSSGQGISPFGCL